MIIEPRVVDFGNVEVNSTATKSLTVTNQCGIDVDITIGTLKGTDPLLFATVPSTGTVITLRYMETTVIEVQYTPLVPSPTVNQAYFSLKLCSSGTNCEPLVTLQGTAVSACLRIDPYALDFGFTEPGSSVVKFVTLSVLCNGAVHLTGDPVVLNSDAVGGVSPQGAYQPGPGFPTKDTVIPLGQSIQLPVVFTPPIANEFIGELDLSTDDATNSNIKILLTGFGGGAAISCAPTALDFGLSAVGMSSTLGVVCTNVGTAVPGHPEANLFIPDPNSTDQGLTLQNGDPTFSASFDAPFPFNGIPAGQSLALTVLYQPTLTGTDMDALVVHSNAHPSSTLIPLNGLAKVLPNCNFQINPSDRRLDFGRVLQGAHAFLPFEIVNLGSDECIVNGCQLGSGGSPAFSIPALSTSSNSQTIRGNDNLQISVEFAPTSGGTFDGTVSFSISDPAAPKPVITLTGTSS